MDINALPTDMGGGFWKLQLWGRSAWSAVNGCKPIC